MYKNKIKYNSDNMIKKCYINFMLKKNGLDVNSIGQISYNTNKMVLKAEAIYLLRHGETLATQNHEFMSDNSKNSHICKQGIQDILKLADNIDQYNFDEVIVCSNIPRIIETTYVFKLLNPKFKYTFINNIKGINNSGWEGKIPETLEGIDLNDFIEREIKHNIYAKSSKGGSWGLVFLNTIKLIKYLNKKHINKRILLISQGSVLKAMEILTQNISNPWDNYDTQKLYNLDKAQVKSNYAIINCLYDKESK